MRAQRDFTYTMYWPTWQWATVVAPAGLLGVATLICCICYYKYGKRDRVTSNSSSEEGGGGNYNNATVLTPPRRQLYQAYRSSSSIDISSASLDPHDNNNIDIDIDYNNNNVNINSSGHAAAEAGDILSSLPDVVVDEEKSNLPGGGDGKECAICLSEYESGEKIKWLPCTHSYHDTCLATWFRHNVVCPLCKLPFYYSTIN